MSKLRLKAEIRATKGEKLCQHCLPASFHFKSIGRSKNIGLFSLIIFYHGSGPTYFVVTATAAAATAAGDATAAAAAAFYIRVVQDFLSIIIYLTTICSPT